MNDVFVGDMADLTRVMAIYHLDGDKTNQVITFKLTGEFADTAWELIADGREYGKSAEFETDRNAPMCSRAISQFLQVLGGPFDSVKLLWTPTKLGKRLMALNPNSNSYYTIKSKRIQDMITEVRNDVNLRKPPY